MQAPNSRAQFTQPVAGPVSKRLYTPICADLTYTTIVMRDVVKYALSATSPGDPARLCLPGLGACSERLDELLVFSLCNDGGRKLSANVHRTLNKIATAIVETLD